MKKLLAILLVLLLLLGACAKVETLEKEQARELTAEELEFFEEYTHWLSGNGNSEISCFFTSEYSDPRDMDAFEFVWALPGGYILTTGDEEEFDLVIDAENKITGSNVNSDLSLHPVPCHRFEREYVNEILMKYAGITVEDMNTDWFEKAIYVPETDCFYSFRSDVGGGFFEPTGGESCGDTVTLYGASDVLTLKKSGESWLIASYLHQ